MCIMKLQLLTLFYARVECGIYCNYSEYSHKIKVPRDMAEVKELAVILGEYKQRHLFHVTLIYALVFILYERAKQKFPIRQAITIY